MKISQLPLSKQTRVETTTDAFYILSNDFQLQSYINRYGDVDTVYDERYNVHRVPAFREQIERYTEMKAADCRIWGCE